MCAALQGCHSPLGGINAAIYAGARRAYAASRAAVGGIWWRHDAQGGYAAGEMTCQRISTKSRCRNS
jgi:hypothetical protein